MAERAHPENPAFRGTVYEERLRERYAFCLPYIQGCDVLDIPCGTGWGSSMLSGYASLTGLDIDEGAIAYAREHFPAIQFVTGPMQLLPFEGGSFDVIICLEGLEHIYLSDAIKFLAEAHRVLRAGGRLILTAPLLHSGKHSGNPYHMYEFGEQELQQLLEAWFESISFEVFAGGDSPEVRFVGQRKIASVPIRDTIQRPNVFEKTHSWLLSLHHENGFRFATNHERSLMSSCWAILTLEGLGQIHALSTNERDTLAAYILDHQQQDSGLFVDPLLERFPIESSTHDHEYVLHQMTYFALQALDALGLRARYPLRFMVHWSATDVLVPWLERLDWSNAWLQSNRVMFILAFFIYQAEVESDRGAAANVHTILDWLDQQQDAESGLWGIAQGSSSLNGMAAAYHFLPFFQYVRRPSKHLNALIDSTLALQQPDGMFGPGLGGGACEDLDAIDVLALVSRSSQYRADDVRRALVRAFWAIWNMQNDDGSFGYAGRTTAETYRFSSWAPMEIELRVGDTWATWFRLLSLATIRELYPNDVPNLGIWQFRRWPALGYHRTDQAIAEHEDTHAQFWMRSLSDARPPVEQPSISIIIPCYNLGLYLYEAVESALTQTLADVEVILVDDGSTDRYTQLACDRMAEHPRVQLLRQENRGLPAARNAGIRSANAAYICCLDADDRLMPTFLEQALNLLDSDPQVGFVSCFYREFDERAGLVQYPTCDLPEMLWINRAMVAALFRHTAWEHIGGYCETMRGMHDWDLWIGMLEAGYQGRVVPEILFEYRVREGSMYRTSSQPANYARLIGQIIERHMVVYQRWFPQVVAGWATEFARLVAYADGQAQLVRQYHPQYSNREELRNRANHAESLVNGLQAEISNWQKIAEERTCWITQLEAARDYWLHSADERAGWIAQLEAARDYHHQQADNWQAATEVAQREIQALTIERDTLARERDTLLNEGLLSRVKRQIKTRRRTKGRTRPVAE